MVNEPESLVLEMLRRIRAEMATKTELAELRREFSEMGAKSEADHKATREQIVGLRRAVIEYHSVVIGHGILISELEARIRRVEQHLELPAMDAH
jgi:predicted  nucleic acid-binding Zn-ribbon protein